MAAGWAEARGGNKASPSAGIILPRWQARDRDFDPPEQSEPDEIVFKRLWCHRVEPGEDQARRGPTRGGKEDDEFELLVVCTSMFPTPIALRSRFPLWRRKSCVWINEYSGGGGVFSPFWGCFDNRECSLTVCHPLLKYPVFSVCAAFQVMSSSCSPLLLIIYSLRRLSRANTKPTQNKD